jgi:hypothetical protein
MPDVPLDRAQLIWDTDEPGLPVAKVLAIPGKDDNRYIASWGACNGDFVSASPADKLLMLLLKYHQLTAMDGLPADELHAVLMDIPEYRRALADFGTIDPALV